MSKERELLNRCAVNLRVRNICPLLLMEITELLNEPELETLSTNIDHNKVWYNVGYRVAKQELERKPLTLEEIWELWVNKSPQSAIECTRLVEEAHKITNNR